MNKIKFSLLGLLFLLALNVAKAANLNFSCSQSSSTITALPTGYTSTNQNDYASLPTVSGYINYEVKNKLTLYVDHAYASIATAYSYTYKIELKTYDASGSGIPSTSTVYLVVEFDPNANPGVAYRDKSVYSFTNAHKIEFRVLDIKNNVTNTWGVTNPQDNIILSGDIDINRIYDFNATTTSSTSYTATDLNANSIDDELSIGWSSISWAEEYDLEWVYIDDYNAGTVSSTISASALDWEFRNNSSRVTTTSTNYKLNLVYERGYLVFRVRGVGKLQSDPRISIFGNWNVADNGSDLTTLPTGSYYRVLAHNNDLNWQYSVVYAEEGKKKEIVSYYDGSLRSRQTVTKINSDNTAVAGESIYDFAGRKAIDILPVPLQTPALDYYANLNLSNTTNAKYTWTDFDQNSGCSSTLNTMKNTIGAANYYSSSNSMSGTGINAYIPDAAGYPFSQTEYEPDNTGRIRRQGGVGPNHQLGSGHETKYYYGQPYQIELDRLFGNEVGHASHYKKNMVMDPNGQISISYLDQEGRVIATSLSGAKPSNVAGLSSYPASPTNLTADLIPSINSSTVNNQNSINLDYTAIEYNTQILVSEPGIHTFNYSLTPLSYSDECLGSICFDCTYDIEIEVRDECGTSIYFDKIKVGSPDPDLTCNNVVYFHSNASVSPFTLDLAVGKYQITKSLTINKDAYEYYLKKYLDPTVNTCFKPFSEFLSEEQEKMDYDGCEITCEQCVEALGTKDDYVISGKGTEADWQKEYDKCMEPCNGTSVCEMAYHMMVEDMKPGGQYAQWYDEKLGNINLSIYPLSILNDKNVLPDQNKAYTDAEGAYWRNPKMEVQYPDGSSAVLDGYYEEDGATRSKIEVVQLSAMVKFPSATSTFFVGSKEYCYPENLADVKDFISFFKPSWAKSLVYYHPEYCYYRWCSVNTNKSYTPFAKTSDEFDEMLLGLETWSAAQSGTTDWTVSITAMIAADPYFHDAPSGSSQTLEMAAAMANYNGTGNSAFQQAAVVAKCGQWLGTNIGVGCNVWNSGTTDELNKMWVTYRNFYLSYKHVLQKKAADQWVTDEINDCKRGYNGCIGENNYTPFPVMTLTRMTSADPCAMGTYLLYKNKICRYDITSSASTGIDEQTAAYNRSYYNHKCPLDLDLSEILGEIASKGNLSTTHTLHSNQWFTPTIYKALLGQTWSYPNSSLPVTYDPWSWIPNINAITNDLEVDFITAGATSYTCGSLPHPLILHLPVGFLWSQVTSMKNLTFDHNVGSVNYFKVDIIVNSVPLTIEGRTCFVLNSCSFEDDTRNTEYAVQLINLYSALAHASDLTAAGVINLESSPAQYSSYLTRQIRNNIGGGSSNNLRYDYSAPLGVATLHIYQNGSTALGDDIVTTFTSYTPSTFTSANVPSIKYFTDLKVGGLSTSFKTEFTVKGWYLVGSVWTSVIITGSVSRGEMAYAMNPIPMACDNIEHRATLDFEKLLKRIIIDHPTSDLNLSTKTEYTGLLESYVGIGNTTLSAPTYSANSISTSIVVRDPVSNDITNNCSLVLERKQQVLLKNPNSAVDFGNITDLGVLRANMKSYQSGGAHEFTAVVKFSNGALEEIRGNISCIPLYSCIPCDEMNSKVNDGLGTKDNGQCPEYDLYVSRVTQFNAQFAPSDVAIADYDENFPCDCVKNYLEYLNAFLSNDGVTTIPGTNPAIDVPMTLGTFSATFGCKLTYGDCCLKNTSTTPHTWQTNTLATLLVNLQSEINTFFNGLTTPPSWWTGTFTIDLESFPCDPLFDDCSCQLKYAQYLMRWTNHNGIYSPYPGYPPHMPMSYADFRNNGCDGGDCWFEYNYYVAEFTARGGTPEPYNPIYGCNFYIRAGKYMPTSGVTLTQYGTQQSLFAPVDIYAGLDFSGDLPISLKSMETIENIPRELSKCTFEAAESFAYSNPCADWLDAIAYGNAQIRYKQYIDDLTTAFYKGYMDKCLSTQEVFNLNYPMRDYHYTLYYYDQAGSLVRTVPPAGVVPVTNSTDLAEIASNREKKERTFYTNHFLQTVYEYNSLNQLLRQSVPDHNKMDRWGLTAASGIPSAMTITDMQFVNANTAYLTGNIGSDGYIYVSDDAGINWRRAENITTPDISDIQMIDGSNGFAIGKNGLVLKTTNGGSDWKILPVLNATSGNSITGTITGVLFKDANNGLVIGPSGFCRKTTDGGNTWTGITTGLPSGTDLLSITMDKYGSTAGTVYVTGTNSGATVIYTLNSLWAAFTDLSISTKLRAADLNDVCMVDASNGYACGRDGTFLKTTNGGANWTHCATGMTASLKKMFFKDINTGIVLDDNGKLWKTTDAAVTWKQASAIGSYKDMHFYNVVSGYGFACGDDGQIAYLDLSVSKSVIKCNVLPYTTDDFTALSFYNSSTGYIFSATTAFKAAYSLGNITLTAIAAPPAAVVKTLFISTTDGAVLATNGLVYKYNNTLNSYVNISHVGAAYVDIDQSGTTIYALHNAGSSDVVYSSASLATFTSSSTIGQDASNINYVNKTIAVGANGNINVNSGTWTDNSNKTAPLTLRHIHALASTGMSSSQTVVAVGDDGTVIRTTDGGSNWLTLPSGTANKLNRVNFYPDASDGIAVGNMGTALLVPKTVGPIFAITTGKTANLNGVAYTAATTAWVVGDNHTAIYTANNGTTWANYSTPESSSTNFSAIAAASGSVSLIGNGGYLAYYTGSIWSSAAKRFNSLNGLHINPSTGKGMTVGNAGINLSTSNSGGNWNYNPPVNLVDYNKCYVNKTDVVYIVGPASFAKTTTLGASSFTALTGITGSYNLKEIVFSDEGYGLIVGGNQVFRSTPTSGGTWSGTTITGATLNSVDIQGKYVCAVGNGKTIYRCADITAVTPVFTDISSSLTLSGGSPNLNKVVMYDMDRLYVLGDGGAMGKTVDFRSTYVFNQKYTLTATTNTTSNLYAMDIGSRWNAAYGGNSNFGMALKDEADFVSTLFWYDRLGRMVVSQNTKQYYKNPTKAYSYTLYDALGRITEVGEKANNTLVETTLSGRQIDDALLSSWISSGAASTRTEVTQTYYDDQFSGVSTSVITQVNLKKRVASVSYEDVYDNNASTYQHATHYTYDVHGNVDHMVQDIPALASINQQYKHVYYDYDLVSGKVNKVDYNPGGLDEFHHKYEYDGDNRITQVYTSRDGIIWDNDASYEYYLHGPLARTELGDLKVQGLDFVYTIQGWIKGVNSNTMEAFRDPGKDGDLTGGNPHSAVAKDAFGYTLGYFQGDFTPIGTFSSDNVKFEAVTAGSSMQAAREDLWNGNISHMVTCLPTASAYSSGYTITPEAYGSAYKYDQLNRLASSRVFTNIDYGVNNKWNSGGSTPTAYSTDYTYDAMGNILTQKRNGAGVGAAVTNLDDLTYHYQTSGSGLVSNRLYTVNDNPTFNTNYSDDIDDQTAFNNTTNTINTANNYGYDELGNLTRDNQEQIASIEWTVYGKIKKVTRTGGSTKADLEFGYDASGNRLWKKVKPKPLNAATEKIYYYLRDAQGNEMCRYQQYTNGSSQVVFVSEEHDIYGIFRHGSKRRKDTLRLGSTNYSLSSSTTFRMLGMTDYELSNHLGNVLATVTDKKVYKTSMAGNYFEAEIVSITDYYPFGSVMQTRSYAARAGRIGFNGKEKEADGAADNFDFGARIYDGRLGRWLSIEPLLGHFVSLSTYSFSYNSPIATLDIDGRMGVLAASAPPRVELELMRQMALFSQWPILLFGRSLFDNVTNDEDKIFGALIITGSTAGYIASISICRALYSNNKFANLPEGARGVSYAVVSFVIGPICDFVFAISIDPIINMLEKRVNKIPAIIETRKKIDKLRSKESECEKYLEQHREEHTANEDYIFSNKDKYEAEKQKGDQGDRAFIENYESRQKQVSEYKKKKQELNETKAKRTQLESTIKSVMENDLTSSKKKITQKINDSTNKSN